MPINMSWKCYVLVQSKCVQNFQERPGIYTRFVQVNIEISKNVKFILKLQSVFKEILKFIKEHCCTSMRAVNAYEIGSHRRKVVRRTVPKTITLSGSISLYKKCFCQKNFTTTMHLSNTSRPTINDPIQSTTVSKTGWFFETHHSAIYDMLYHTITSSKS